MMITMRMIFQKLILNLTTMVMILGKGILNLTTLMMNLIRLMLMILMTAVLKKLMTESTIQIGIVVFLEKLTIESMNKIGIVLTSEDRIGNLLNIDEQNPRFQEF